MIVQALLKGGNKLMGERLVLSIERDLEPVMTAYYQWSGYTKTAINIIKSIHKSLESTSEPSIQDVYKALRKTGAGPSLSMINVNKNDPVFDLDIDINDYKVDGTDGIIDIQSNKMKDAIYYADNLISFDLADKTWASTVFSNDSFNVIIPNGQNDVKEQIIMKLKEDTDDLGYGFMDLTPKNILLDHETTALALTGTCTDPTAFELLYDTIATLPHHIVFVATALSENEFAIEKFSIVE